MKKEFKGRTDWARLENMKDENIDFSDSPEVTEDMVQNYIIRKDGQTKLVFALPIDETMAEWLSQRNQSCESIMTEALQNYYQQQKRAS